MPKRTGAQIIWECLVHEGVHTVFGAPGGAILPAYDAMLDYPVRHVLVRHEQGATHMADGFARAGGGVGVAVATSGPGATNMVTGIATAMMDSSPIVCITGQVPEQADWLRRVPGDRHYRYHAADHQTQLPCDARPGHHAGDEGGISPGEVGPPGSRTGGYHEGRSAGLGRLDVGSRRGKDARLPPAAAGDASGSRGGGRPHSRLRGVR